MMVAGVLVLAVWPRTSPRFAMKFTDVPSVALRVLRYSSSITTYPKVVFGSNNTWIVFKDYVVSRGRKLPKEAGDVIAAIRKTTDKPIKFVLDTHHHGDHAYGNCIYGRRSAPHRR